MDRPQELERVRVVLNEPQDLVNIGGVVRAMKNMGLTRLALVRPAEFDAHRIEGIAHTGMDVIERASFHEGLDDALEGANVVFGTSARGRRVRREYRRPREAAAEILATARAGGEVALVFGREDRGLSNTELDRCDRVIQIPTDPERTSINLAGAVLLIAYELFLAATGDLPFKVPRRDAVPAAHEELEALFEDAQLTLEAIEFFKSDTVDAIMRTVREVAGRADLDSHEAALLRAMAIEVRNYVARVTGERPDRSADA